MMHINLIFQVLIISAAVSASLPVQALPGNESKDLPVRYIRFECPAEIQEDLVLQAIALRENDVLTPESIRKSIRNLHLLDLFKWIDVEMEPFQDGCAVIFILEPNWLVDDISFRGGAISFLFNYGLTGGFSPKTLKREIGLKSSDIYTESVGEASIAALADFYYRQGYGQSTISLNPVFDSETHTVDLVYTIEQGSPTRIQSITIEGNTSISRQDVLSAADVFIGRHFSRDLISEAQEKVLRLYRKQGFISAQVFRPEVRYISEKNTIHVTFRIKEEIPVDIAIETDWHTWNILWWLYMVENRQDAFLQDLGISGSGRITMDRLEEGRRALEQRFWNYGYLNAIVHIDQQQDESGKLRYTFVVDEQEIIRVSDIRFFGNQGFSQDEFLSAGIIGTRIGKKYHHDTFNADGADLKAFYLRNGYRDVQIISGFTIDKTNETVAVVFTIDEGPHVTWKSIAIEGNYLLDTDSIQQILHVVEGGPYDPDYLVKNMDALTEHYLKNGYTEFSVDHEIRDQESINPSLHIVINEGVPATIESVLITGYSKTLRSVIRRNMPDLAGQPFYYQALLDAERSLIRTNLFRSVDVDGLMREIGLTDRTVLIRVREQPSIFLEGGPGYNTDRGFNGFLSFYTTNLGGANRYLGASASISQEDQKTSVIYREPEFANLPVQLELRLLTEDSAEDGYRLERRGGRATWSYRIHPQFRLLLVYRFDDDKPYNIEENADLPEEYQYSIKIGSLSPGFLFDSRDDPRDPTRGSLFSVKAEFARSVYNSEVDFSKVTAEATHFFDLPGDGVLGTALRFGFGYHLPYQERFRLGGIKTIRGWDYEDI
ncbi:BamA/TamA family outer membrane protein, partial [bacterium]|nr:BamA/TamA family outer membrane protein [candidate division CSSED10-310 bacterium]